jgi:hypothetical protein
MTKKFLIGTAIAAVLATASYAEEASPNVSQTDLYGGIWTGESNGVKWTSRWARVGDSDGKCFWWVHEDFEYADGVTDGRPTHEDYNTKIPCDDPHPKVNGISEASFVYIFGPPITRPLPTPICPPRLGWTKSYVISFWPLEEAFYYADGTIIICRDLQLKGVVAPPVRATSFEDLKKALEKPEASHDLLNGKPDSDGDQPALSDPKTAKQSPKAQDKASDNSRVGAPNKSGEKAPGTDQKSQSTERQSESKPKSNAEKSNAKPTDSSEKSDSKSTGSSEHLNAKSARTVERADAKSENRSEHATRTVPHEKPEVTHPVAHMTEAGHMGGMREAGMHMGGLAGTHASGLGGLGGMHLGGFGGLGGLGGIHLGGFGKL